MEDVKRAFDRAQKDLADQRRELRRVTERCNRAKSEFDKLDEERQRLETSITEKERVFEDLQKQLEDAQRDARKAA